MGAILQFDLTPVFTDRGLLWPQRSSVHVAADTW